MASKRIELHQEAAAEYEGAFDWYFDRSPLAASKFADEIDQVIDEIAQTPQRWPIHIHGTRKLSLPHFPFLVVYRELPSAIQVLAIAHGHRRPGYWKERLQPAP
jgi:plasmid stabilization system protein ParE